MFYVDFLVTMCMNCVIVYGRTSCKTASGWWVILVKYVLIKIKKNHWGRDEMTVISPTHSSAFSWLKFVPKGPINNIPALLQIMVWRRAGDKPLSEPMTVRLPKHIGVTRPQWFSLFIDNTDHDTLSTTITKSRGRKSPISFSRV